MKILTLLCLCVCTVVCVHAQVADVPTMDTACSCIKRIDSKLSNERYEEELKQCVVSAMMKNPEILALALKQDENSSEVGEKLGKEFTMELMQHCPEATTAFMRIGGNSSTRKEKDTKTGSAVGTLERIDTKGYIMLVLKVNGRETSFLWLRHFDGSDNLKNGIGKMKGKKVTLQWREIECYNSVLKDYVLLKEIMAIEEAN